MAKLPKLTLEFNEKKERWDLKRDKTRQVVTSFATKDDATRRGSLRKALSNAGGSVKIQTKDGRIEEERTFPASADPHSRRG